MSQVSPLGDAAPNTQELFNLITQLAHYLKILIRIALTGSIKLERDQARLKAMANALARLNLLAMDGSDPAVKKRGDVPETPPPQLVVREKDGTVTPGGGGDEEQLKRAMDSLTRRPEGFIASTQGIAYGYRSLAVSDPELETSGDMLTCLSTRRRTRQRCEVLTTKTSSRQRCARTVTPPSRTSASVSACSTAGTRRVCSVASAVIVPSLLRPHRKTSHQTRPHVAARMTGRHWR
jgi:hypothetical protein